MLVDKMMRDFIFRLHVSMLYIESILNHSKNILMFPLLEPVAVLNWSVPTMNHIKIFSSPFSLFNKMNIAFIIIVYHHLHGAKVQM